MNQFARIVAVTLWAVALIACILVSLQLHPDPGLEAVIPRGDPQLDREVRFFENRAAAQILALEAEAEDPQAALGVLRQAALDLESAGAWPQAPPSPAAAIRLTDRIHQHLPALVTPQLLAELEDALDQDALVEHLRELRNFLLEPGNEVYAPAIYRDVLGIEGRVLTQVSGELMAVAANATEDGILRHPEGQHAALVLQVDRPPGDAAASAELMSRVEQLQDLARHRGVTLRAIGAYRHFDDNYSQIWRDLAITLPISLLLILGVLYSLFRRERDLLALHMPALAGVAGGTAAVVLVLGPEVPLMVLGFGAGMLGIAVDYGIHMTRACRDGVSPLVRKPLLLSFATAATAFSMLLVSDVPALRTLGLFVVTGLAMAVATALLVLPRLLRRRQQRDPWRRVSDRLVGFTSERRWWGLAVAVVITVLAAPGLWRLELITDPQALDGSRPETIQDLEDFSQRWGLLTGSHFVVAEGPELKPALSELGRAKQAAGLPPGLPELLLPGPEEQASRRAAWTGFWQQHLAPLERNLAVACRRVGLRASAFTASFASYARTDCPEIEATTWIDTPMRSQLDELVNQDASGRWQVVSPVDLDDPARFAATESALAGKAQVWLASRRLLGRHLVTAMGDELRRLGLFIAAALLVVLTLLMRRPRRVLAVLIPPAVALAWTFGSFGYLGLELSALHVLVATFIAGIGIDDSIFLSRSELRGHAMSPILATTATSLAGVGAMAFAGHPVVQSVGLAIFIGMSCCLLACLLVCPAFDARRDRPTIRTVELRPSPPGTAPAEHRSSRLHRDRKDAT